MRTTTYSPDGKVRCPYCNSVQVKRARNQPKKYPTPSFLAKTAKTPEFQFWVNGYDCKKCGNEFILESNPQPVTPPPSQPLPPTITSPASTAPLARPKKKGGCLGLIIKLIIIAAIALFAYGYFHNRGGSSHKTAKQDKSSSIEKSQNKNETLSITETHTVKNKD